MEAIVLAGGLGTRLRDVVSDVPKPMAPVRGRPFLSFVLDRLVDSGFTTAVLATGYRHEALQAYFGERYRGLALTYSVEADPLGTGGAIRLAWDRIGPREVFVLNGDTYLEVDYGAMRASHSSASAMLTIAVCHVADAGRYGALELADDRVQGFSEKGRAGAGWINGGTYLLAPSLHPRLPSAHAFSFERDFLQRDVGRLEPLAFRSSGRFIDIGTPEDYARAEYLLPAQQRSDSASCS
jgi:D-glycero-alpha-D-manno-heptose 1-phosphate guanylyltransferase